MKISIDLMKINLFGEKTEMRPCKYAKDEKTLQTLQVLSENGVIAKF